MRRKISLGLVGAILAPAVLAAFAIGLIAAGVLNLTPAAAKAEDFTFAQMGTGLGEAEHSPFVRVAELVQPTVVHIAAEKTVRTGRSSRGSPAPGSPLEDMLRDFFREFPEMPQERQSSALGSGVIVSPDGYIVTNNHVVAGFDRFSVRLHDGTEFKGKDVKVVGRDPKTDLAVIKVESDRPLQSLKPASPGDIRVGEWAIAVGNPFGLEGTVTVGVISAKSRSGLPLPEGPSYQDFIQTDASINPGNSGGALVNIRGELLGINSAIRSPTGGNVGIGFAVPIDLVQPVVQQLISTGKVVRGYMGIRPQEVTDAIRKAMNLDDTKGVLVSEVVDGTPADRAGLKAGDVIVKVEDTKTDGVEQFRRQVAAYMPGQAIAVVVVRDGKRLNKTVKLVEFPEDEPQAQARPGDEEDGTWLGLSVRNLTDEERAELKLESGGVLVTSVESGSAADEAGLQRGDVILQVAGEPVSGATAFGRAVREQRKSDKPILLRVRRGSSTLFIAVEPTE
jgi:serine protease Do